jgi:SAM-dependent methyltransferase
MKDITTCLICGSGQSGPFLVCKDYTVSQKEFAIRACSSCGFKFTSPRPNDEDLGDYYKAESYVSHSDTKKGLVNKLYHWVRTYTLVKKVQLVMRHTGKRGTILDYGCGTGAFIGLCKKNGWTSFGIEPDSTAREISERVNDVTPFTDLESARLGMSGKKVNAITMWHVLEHVSDIPGLFKFFDEILSSNGTLIIAVPNCSSHDAKYYQHFWAAYDVPRHLWHFIPKDILSLIRSYGYRHIETRPMVFDSFYVSMLSESYKRGRPALFRAFWRGLVSNIKANKTGQEFSSQIYVFKKA